MRIGIDARLFGPRVGGGGLGRYLEQLILHLEKLDQENEYVIFLRRENWGDYQPKAPNFKKVLAPWRWYTLAEQIHMPGLIRKAKLDLTHYPHFNVPIFARTPFVVTIHDLNLLEYPKTNITTLDPIRFWAKYLGYRFVLSQSLKKARTVITVSDATRQAILERFHVPEKITTIHSGYTITNFPQPKTYNLKPKTYILAVGNAYPHKNLIGLLAAFHQTLRSAPNLTLVLTGPEDRFRERIRHRSRELGVSDRVIFTGFVTDEELDSLYRNAAAYIMPSFLEGFGFPGLEAQARNTPVLASDIPALRETLGETALYFNPKDPYSISATILKILNNNQLAESLKNAGLENTKRFDWQKTAEKTRAVYKKASIKA